LIFDNTTTTKGGASVDKLCGICSQEKGLTMEERIALAKSRIPNVVYTCSECLQEHVYRGNTTPTSLETTTEQETQVEKNSVLKSKQNGDQLSMF
jgi:RNase P subunit RPR2